MGWRVAREERMKEQGRFGAEEAWEREDSWLSSCLLVIMATVLPIELL